jgi:hypothetical protein
MSALGGPWSANLGPGKLQERVELPAGCGPVLCRLVAGSRFPLLGRVAQQGVELVVQSLVLAPG